MVSSFAAACLSKEQAMTLPVLATVYEHFYRDDRTATSWKQKLSRYGLLWLMAVAYLLFRIRFFGALAPVDQIPGMSWYQTFLSAFALTGQYVWKLIWPVHLCAFYVFRKSPDISDPRALAGIAALGLAAALFAVLWKQERLASFGLLWLFATLGPVLNARWMAANVFAERYLYLPSVGFSWVFAWASVRLWDSLAARNVSSLRSWRRALAAALGVAGILCVARVVTRNQDWRDDVVLYARTLADSPDAYHIHNNLGTVYWERGQVTEAEREWRLAVKLAPHNAVILNNLGLASSKRKRYPEATDLFRQAMQFKPKYTDPHLNLGVVYAEMGLRDEAESQFRTAVALSPLNVRARNELGRLYLDSGRLAEAEEQFRQSAKSEPNAAAYDGLGDIAARLAAREKTQEAFQQALSLAPYDSHAHFGLAALYVAAGQDAKALNEYQAGLQTDPSNREALTALQELKSRASHRPSSKR